MATTTATDDGALLRMAVCSNPADDTARLVYADWLQENGGETWAQYIRKQVAARAGEQAQPESRYAIAWGLARPLWAAGLKLPFCVAGDDGGAFPGHVGERFARGFVSHVAMPCADFLKHAAAVFAAHPVETVRLVDRDPVLSLVSGERSWMKECRGVRFRRNCRVIPAALFRRLPRWRRGESHLAYPSLDAALLALSEACVAHGRKLAGFLPLPAETTA